MYVYFSMDEPTYLKIITLIRSGAMPSPRKGDESVPVAVGLADDQDRKFPLSGTFDFVNNQVDKLTATITIRARLANPFEPDGVKPPLLRPGMFVRVRVSLGEPKPRLLVPEQAVGTDQGYKFLWVLDKDDKAHQRRVTPGQSVEGWQVIETGLEPTDRVVVRGLQRCRADEVMKSTTVAAEEVVLGGLPASLQPPAKAEAK
jgi:RND family efflux transporter MFP subunit